ncbi:hypothetical protein N183_34730 [Sinorhizobium sp. Sb3]|nr:hypothetical protein N183_34730 [Sinorhizobium sp. Sb3]
MTFDDLLATYEPRLATAFSEAIDQIKSSIVLARVIERLERGDINGAVEAMQIEPEAFSALEIALQEAFNAGGAQALSCGRHRKRRRQDWSDDATFRCSPPSGGNQFVGRAKELEVNPLA